MNPPPGLPTSGRPLVNMSLAMNYHWGHLDPQGYHVFNLIVHFLSSLMLWAIVRRTLELEYFGGRFNAVSNPIAFLAALLWAVHPLQTETVVYITQRTELLVGFFYLATLYGSLCFWDARSPGSRVGWLAVSTLACWAGMACKEVMVSAPLVVLVFERTFMAGTFRQAMRKSWPLYVGLFLGWAVLWALNADQPRADSAGFQLGVPAYAWWFTQAKVLWMYLRLSIWPWPLSIHYELPYLDSVAAAWPWLTLTAGLVIAVLLLAWRRFALGFAGFWVLAILLPTLVVPIVTEVAAERRMYLPTAALVTVFVAAGYALCQRAVPTLTSATGRPSVHRRLIAIYSASMILLAAALSVVSAHRTRAFRDPVLLWQDAVATQPNDFVAYNNLSGALNDAGRWKEARIQAEEAMRLKPGDAKIHYNLAMACAKSGDPEDAIAHYQEALKLRPNYAEASNNLGNVFLNAGQPAAAIPHYQRALEMNPELANAEANWGAALIRLGRSQEAIGHYERALRLQPDNAATYANLAKVYARTKQSAEAIAAAETALALARSTEQTALAAQIEGWLRAYRASKTNASTGTNDAPPPSQ